METFTDSLERMQRQKRDAATRLLELISFLSDTRKSLSFRAFFGVHRPWLEKVRADLPDYDIFTQSLDVQNEYLLELERVSIGVRLVVPSVLQIHPLWVECVQQRAQYDGRLRWLRQISILCYTSFVHDLQQYTLCPEPFQADCDRDCHSL